MSLILSVCNIIIAAFLRTKNIAILEYCNGGVPIRYPFSATMPDKFIQMGFFAKVIRFIKNVSSLSELKKTLSTALFLRFGRLLPSATTHRLVAGEDWSMLAQAKSREKNRVKLIYGHSEDYSNSILHKLNPVTFLSPYNKIAVFLDAPGPKYDGDAVFIGRKEKLTSNVWYPALCLFFDRIEAETGVKVVIAGHYKSSHPAIAPHFGYRSVYYGKTRELVWNSEFVITRSSTAISYAVMFRKPVIFIYSNQLNEDRLAMQDICGMAAVLGNVPVNIDKQDIEINSMLKVKESNYMYYKKACLTSERSQKPNVQIILEEVMNIATGPELLNEDW